MSGSICTISRRDASTLSINPPPPPPLIRVALNAFSFADVRPNKEIYGHGTPYRVDSYTFTVDSHVQILSTEYSGP